MRLLCYEYYLEKVKIETSIRENYLDEDNRTPMSNPAERRMTPYRARNHSYLNCYNLIRDEPFLIDNERRTRVEFDSRLYLKNITLSRLLNKGDSVSI